jgi:hypothetical protein
MLGGPPLHAARFTSMIPKPQRPVGAVSKKPTAGAHAAQA